MNFDNIMIFISVAIVIGYCIAKELKKGNIMSILKIGLGLSGAVLLIISLIDDQNIIVIKIMFLYSLSNYIMDIFDELHNVSHKDKK